MTALVFAAVDFDSLDFGPHSYFKEGVCALTTYPNGYGVSVVRHSGSYGWPEKYELAVIKVVGDGWNLVYDTPITEDVLGHLTPEDVTETMQRVAALPAQGD